MSKGAVTGLLPLLQAARRLLRTDHAAVYRGGRVLCASDAPESLAAEAAKLAHWAAGAGAPVILPAASATMGFFAATPCADGAVLVLFSAQTRQPPSADEMATLNELAAAAGHLTAALAESAHYREIFEHSSTALAVSHVGRHVLANDAYLRLFGIERADLDRLTILDLIAPGERERLLRLNEERERGRTVPSSYETTGLAKTGEFEMQAHVSRYELDGVPYTLASIIDIRERKQAEEELRQANETLRALFQASPVPIVAFDPNGLVELWNQAAERTFGYTEAEVLHGTIPYVPEERREEFEMVRNLTLQGIGLSNLEVQRRHKSGTLIELALSTAPMRDRTGAVRGVMAVYVDVTERNRMEQRLNEAQKMEAIGRLAGGIAHDFNNLLTVITGYSQMLLESTTYDDDSRPLMEEVLLAAERAAKLTNQLLAFGRRQMVPTQAVSLIDHVASMRTLLHRVIGEHIELTTTQPESLPLVSANPTQIEQVILNLVLNARDAMPGGGRLTIELSAETLGSTAVSAGIERGKYVVLAVRDSGHGIDPDTRARIFEPFFTTKEQGKGTGLGLATVYGIVKQHGGYIDVESEEGVGSTFRVYLPVTSGVYPVLQAVPEQGVGRGHESILVTEDEPALRRLVVDMLRSEGYRVLEASAVADALRLAADTAERIDLLLSDVVMPEMGGPELAQKVRELRADVEIAYMSGYMDQHVSRQVLQEHGRFIQKPFTKAALARFIRDILDRRNGQPQSHAR